MRTLRPEEVTGSASQQPSGGWENWKLVSQGPPPMALSFLCGHRKDRWAQGRPCDPPHQDPRAGTGVAGLLSLPEIQASRNTLFSLDLTTSLHLQVWFIVRFRFCLCLFELGFSFIYSVVPGSEPYFRPPNQSFPSFSPLSSFLPHSLLSSFPLFLPPGTLPSEGHLSQMTAFLHPRE